MQVNIYIYIMINLVTWMNNNVHNNIVKYVHIDNPRKRRLKNSQISKRTEKKKMDLESHT
jgi:hypothetical protein